MSSTGTSSRNNTGSGSGRSRFNGRRRNSAPNGQGGRPGQRRRRGGAGSNQGRRYYNNGRQRNDRPLTREEQLVNRYMSLLDLHLQARSKYYDVFELPDYNRRKKWERAFDQTLEDLRHFESTLSAEDKLTLEKHTNGQRPDLTYSENRQLVGVQVESYQGEIEDPHFLGSQEKAMQDYRDDEEESVGNYDDYLKYKGQRSS